MNSIENLWSIKSLVKQRIDRNNVQNADEFFNRIKNVCYATTQATIIHLIESMPQRDKAVKDSNCLAMKY